MKYLSSTIIFVHNFTLKITSARARIRARLNKRPVVSLVEKNKGPGYKTSKYGAQQRFNLCVYSYVGAFAFFVFDADNLGSAF